MRGPRSPAPPRPEPRAKVSCSGGGPGGGAAGQGRGLRGGRGRGILGTPPSCLLIGPFETGGGDSPRTLRPRRSFQGASAPHRLSRDVAPRGRVSLLGQGG